MHLDCLKLAMIIFTLWKLVNAINLGSCIFLLSEQVFNHRFPVLGKQQEAVVGRRRNLELETDTSCVWLVKLLSFSELQFSHLSSGDIEMDLGEWI